MNNELQIADVFLTPLFDEIYVVKEKDFSIHYNVLGEGKQKLLLVVDAEGVDFLPGNQMELLKSIVDKGLRKAMDDVWLINLESCKNASLADVLAYFKPHQVIVWGCGEWLLRDRVKIDIHGQTQFLGSDLLRADILENYLTDKSRKARLWTALQRMFFN